MSHDIPVFNLLRIRELRQSSCTILQPHQCCVQSLSFCFNDVKNRSGKMAQPVKVLVTWGLVPGAASSYKLSYDFHTYNVARISPHTEIKILNVMKN